VKYFICALGKVNLGIPAGQTERVIPVTRPQTAVYEIENREAYISVPALFRQNNAAAPHGLVLKTTPAGCERAILLTPRIDIDLEIPAEDIHRLSEAFTGIFSFVSGVCFSREEDMILILDTEKIITNCGACFAGERIERELA